MLYIGFSENNENGLVGHKEAVKETLLKHWMIVYT